MDKLTKSKIDEVASDIRSCLIEAVFSSHWILIESTHYVGELIVKNFGSNMSEALPDLAKKVGRSARTLYRAAQLYKKFPDINSIPHGKAISLNKIINEYLLESGEKKEEKCKHCLIHCK